MRREVLDGVTGNDPASLPWQSSALPLCYTPWSGQPVLPRRSPRWQRGVFLARLWPHEIWLPRQDSNLDRLIQNQPCYRYTTGHWCRRVESNHQGLSTTDLQSAEPTALLNSGLKIWWIRPALLRLPPACKAGALLIELRTHDIILVDPEGVAPSLAGCEPAGLLLILWTQRICRSGRL